MSKKILAVYGSFRENSNSSVAVDEILNNVCDKDAVIDRVYLSKVNVNPCRGCFACRKTGVCVINDDMTNDIIGKIAQADVLIFSIPVFMFQAAGVFKVFLDRCYTVLSGEDGIYANVYGPKDTYVIYSQGAPVEQAFAQYMDLNDTVLSNLNFKVKKRLVCTSSNVCGSIKENTKLLEEAAAIGKAL